MLIRAPTVTTPVPPTPVTRRSNGLSRAGRAGAGSCPARATASTPIPVLARRRAPSTVTKLGQNPLRHEKSLLQVDRLIRRLRPKGVSLGSTLRQFDSTEQSPHASQTRSLM